MEYAGLLMLAYRSAAVGILLRYLPPTTALVFLTIPQAVHLCRGIWAHGEPLPLTRDLRGTAELHQRAGLLLGLAFLLRQDVPPRFRAYGAAETPGEICVDRLARLRADGTSIAPQRVGDGWVFPYTHRAEPVILEIGDA